MYSLYAALCSCKIGFTSPTVIARLCWRNVPAPPSVTRTVTRHMEILTAQDETGTLTMWLLPAPRKESRPVAAAPPLPAVPWHCFTRAEIMAFTAEVGDTNSLHQGSHPVVPGYLMLRPFITAHPEKTLTMKFRRPVRAGETILLATASNRCEGYTYRGHVWTLLLS